MTDRPFVLVSNRGPISFQLDEAGQPVPSRGAGGLVSGLGPLVAGTGTVWIAAAMSPGDRAAAARGMTEAEGFRVRLLDVDERTYRKFYDVACNATLWFLHHGLFDLARRPSFDRRWREAWECYEQVNRQFAEAVAEEAPPGSAVLVQDYHLSLLGPMLSRLRDDLLPVHFSHTPFAPPDALRVLPSDARAALMGGLAGHKVCGFHSERWARAFSACCAEAGIEAPEVLASPLAPDPADLATAAASPACERAIEQLSHDVGDRMLVVRVDRIELSKNLLRGFLAFDDLLDRYPAWRSRVTFAALVYPSREGLPEYLAYRQEVETLVARINERWGNLDWTPVLLDTRDHFPASVAALRSYDVLLVNPIRDGLNLVAKEGPLLNERDGVLALSPEAGAWDEMGSEALKVEPFDVSGTADVLASALEMPPPERARRSAALRRLAGSRTPADWLADLRSAAG